MNKLILIGYWNNLNNDYPEYPMPKENKNRVKNRFSRIIDNDICKYLDSGYKVNSMRGFSSCRICGIINGSAMRTDGKYIWPIGLSHYIEKHGVQLPMPFLKHLISNKIPYISILKNKQIFSYDDTFWIKYNKN